MQGRYYRCGHGGWRHPGLYKTAPVNIEETEAGYTLYLYAPAIAKENISITTQNDVLSIQCKPGNENAGTHFTRREYRPGEIQRVFELKGKVDTDKIRAAYAEGILTIELPKTEAARKPSRDVHLG